MPKFSFIVPAYNVEKYIEKCINSLLNQTFNDFEIIIVNDGSTDNTQSIIDQYKKEKKIKSYVKENGGLSDARNFGIGKASGKYLLFVDSDDYVSLTMLEEINEVIENSPDIVKFSFSYVKGNTIETTQDNLIVEGNGEYSFIKLVNNKKPFEMACMYAYKKEFWDRNKFMFPIGRYHEDFGLIPLVILKANIVSTVNDSLYFYVQSENSITRNSNITKTIKRTNDMLYHYDYLKEEFDKMKIKDEHLKNIFYSYISNALIFKAKELNGKHLKIYIKELKNRNVFDNILSDSFVRKVKKYLLKLFSSIFIKLR